jgi:hypothetical protein
MATTYLDAIENLEFYSAEGKTIPMQKQYTITWEIIPNI